MKEWKEGLFVFLQYDSDETQAISAKIISYEVWKE